MKRMIQRTIYALLLGVALLTSQTVFAYYNPATGRFLSRDPVGEPGFQALQMAQGATQVGAVPVAEQSSKSLNRGPKDNANTYRFVYNNPVNNIDPLGLWMWFWKPSVKVDGGTPDERRNVRRDLNDIYNTDRGNELRKMIRKEGLQRCIHLNAASRNQGQTPGPDIWIDPNSHPTIQTTAGPQAASTRRIISHELGHAVTGTGDDGPNDMNNVNQNENPIVGHLPIPEPARTQY
jgi:uncharacterized protein RhaS with RHS repeats